MTVTKFNPFGPEFEDPEFDHPPGPRKPEFDKWSGRYCDLPPVPGYEDTKLWTRVSTLKETIEDKSLLEAWKQRQVLLGILADTRILGDVGPQLDPKSKYGRNKLNGLVERAKQAAGANKGRDAGTDYHAVLEGIQDGSLTPADLTEDQYTWLDAIEVEMKSAALQFRPVYSERVVVIPEIGCAGTLDGLLWDGASDVLRIGDLKTQGSLDFGQIGLCIQLSVYSRASFMLDPVSWTWQNMPYVAKDQGVIIWAPAAEIGRVELKGVDLEFGWEMALLSHQVRTSRNRKKIITNW